MRWFVQGNMPWKWIKWFTNFLKMQIEQQQQTKSIFILLKQHIDQVQAEVSRSAAFSADHVPQTFTQIEYEEYLQMVQDVLPERAPPYVPVFDGDINRVGRDILTSWMGHQRMVGFRVTYLEKNTHKFITHIAFVCCLQKKTRVPAAAAFKVMERVQAYIVAGDTALPSWQDAVVVDVHNDGTYTVARDDQKVKHHTHHTHTHLYSGHKVGITTPSKVQEIFRYVVADRQPRCCWLPPRCFWLPPRCCWLPVATTLLLLATTLLLLVITLLTLLLLATSGILH